MNRIIDNFRYGTRTSEVTFGEEHDDADIIATTALAFLKAANVGDVHYGH